jgi:hypothetical protein
MKRRRKTVVVVGLLLALLVTIWWLSVPEAQQLPQLTFVGFTNSVAGNRMATFSISNTAHGPVNFAPVVEVQTADGSYERWAAGPPEMPATALLGNLASTFATTVPDSGTPWRLRLIWQPKPTEADYAYANGLDRLLRLCRQQGYPKSLVPSARIWHEITSTPEMPHAGDAEPIASPNAAPPHR